MAALTILITTYNRAPLLKLLLEKLSSYQDAGLDFAVNIFDDCSTDETPKICKSFEKKISKYSYNRHPKNVGMDINFISAYESCQTEYCWLPGDYRYISFEDMKRVIALLESKTYDALIINCHPNNKVERKDYTDINELMSELGWHNTNQTSFIIPRKFITPTFYKRYIGTTFTHLGMITENLCAMDRFKVAYLNNVRMLSTETGTFTRIGWMRHPFVNFGRLWYQFVMSLPNQITIETKRKVLLDHNRNTGLFNPKFVIRMKLDYGPEVMKSYKSNRQYVPFVSTTPLFIYDMIALTPAPILRGILNTIHRIKTIWRQQGKKREE